VYYGTKSLKNSSKNSKENFLAGYPGTKYSFLRAKSFSKVFWLQLVAGTTI
jgi:hypothetical protein